MARGCIENVAVLLCTSPLLSSGMHACKSLCSAEQEKKKEKKIIFVNKIAAKILNHNRDLKESVFFFVFTFCRLVFGKQ